MSKVFSIPELQKFAQTAVQRLNDFLSNLILANTPKSLKRASLITYWMHDYIKFQEQEDSFNPNHLLRYDRGSIIEIDFGYRIGRELGGRHFAVVIDNENNLWSQTITVVPLKSLKDSYKDSKYHFVLSCGIFNLVNSKINLQLQQANLVIALYEKQLQEIGDKLSHPELLMKSEVTDLAKQLEKIEKAESDNDLLIKQLWKELDKFKKLKSGSVIEVGQIITISKQRIVTPKNTSDVLSGLRLAKEDLSEMNRRIIEMYVHVDPQITK